MLQQHSTIGQRRVQRPPHQRHRVLHQPGLGPPFQRLTLPLLFRTAQPRLGRRLAKHHFQWPQFIPRGLRLRLGGPLPPVEQRIGRLLVSQQLPIEFRNRLERPNGGVEFIQQRARFRQRHHGSQHRQVLGIPGPRLRHVASQPRRVGPYRLGHPLRKLGPRHLEQLGRLRLPGPGRVQPGHVVPHNLRLQAGQRTRNLPQQLRPGPLLTPELHRLPGFERRQRLLNLLRQPPHIGSLPLGQLAEARLGFLSELPFHRLVDIPLIFLEHPLGRFVDRWIDPQCPRRQVIEQLTQRPLRLLALRLLQQASHPVQLLLPRLRLADELLGQTPLDPRKIRLPLDCRRPFLQLFDRMTAPCLQVGPRHFSGDRQQLPRLLQTQRLFVRPIHRANVRRQQLPLSQFPQCHRQPLGLSLQLGHQLSRGTPLPHRQQRLGSRRGPTVIHHTPCGTRSRGSLLNRRVLGANGRPESPAQEHRQHRAAGQPSHLPKTLQVAHESLVLVQRLCRRQPAARGK